MELTVNAGIAGLLTEIGGILTAFLGWVGEAGTVIISKPILLFGFGLAVSGILLKMVLSAVK